MNIYRYDPETTEVAVREGTREEHEANLREQGLPVGPENPPVLDEADVPGPPERWIAIYGDPVEYQRRLRDVADF